MIQNCGKIDIKGRDVIIMLLTLEDVMLLDSMKGATLHNIVGADKIEITGITIMEAPDIADWMKEGQILLASLFSVGDNEVDQKQLVKKLAEKKVAALFIKTRYNKTVNTTLIEQCKEENLALVEIPEKTAYTSITFPVMKRLFNIQLARADYFIESHNAFMQFALNNKGVEAILSELSLRLNKEMILIDNDQKIEFSFMKSITLDNTIEIIGKENKTIEGNLLFYRKKLTNGIIEIPGILFPIKVLDRVKANLFIAIDPNEFFREEKWITIESAITVLKLELLKKVAIDEMIKKSKNELLDDIFTGNLMDIEAIMTKAKVVGWDLSKKYVVGIYKISQKQWKTLAADSISYEMERLVDKLENIISCNSNILTSHYIIRVKNDKIIVLFPWEYEDEDIFTFIINTSKLFQKKIKNECNIEFTNIGIGDISNDVTQLSRSYKEAGEALELGEMIEGQGGVKLFRELGIYRLLCNYKSKEALVEFIPEPLTKLVKYDSESNNSLLNTLEVLLKCDCNASKAAQELFIHYKTLLYRMNKIKAIMGIDFMLYENRLSIEVGMKILKIVDNKKLLN